MIYNPKNDFTHQNLFLGGWRPNDAITLSDFFAVSAVFTQYEYRDRGDAIITSLESSAQALLISTQKK